MRPWQHALSSARGKKDCWEDDLPIHEFMDSSKTACADRRHRVVLHHIDLGAEIVGRVFPDRSDAAALVHQHVTEDLGKPARLADWWELCDEETLPKPVTRRLKNGPSGIAEMVARRLPEDARSSLELVCELLFSPVFFLAECHGSSIPQSERGLPILMNSVGPMIARRLFGPPERVGAGSTMIDHAWLAEAIIYTVYGRIPDLGEVARCWRSEPAILQQNCT